ncbi:MAG: hypothetical protein HXY41_14015 [Chloroflexi bacterium]|nr:hypothetical protein [Chloroflexota bacterium]
MFDFRLLLLLRWRQFRSDALYWLRTVGYQPDERSFSQRLYGLYLALIGAFWAGSMVSWGAEQAALLGASLTPATLSDLLAALPWLALALQVYALASALRVTPLRLSFADIAYLAGSPVDRAAAVMFAYTRQVVARLVPFGALGALVGIVLVTPVDSGARLAAALRGALAAEALLVFTMTLAWTLGILRLIFPWLRRHPWIWLLPFGLPAAAYLLPGVLLWPGRAAIAAIYGEASGGALALLVAGALGLAALMFRLGSQVNMAYASDESIVYARIKALGLMAWRDPRLRLRIYGQAARAGRKPWLHLPKAFGLWGLTTRAALTYLRHPMMLLTSLLWGALMTYVAILLVSEQLPVQIWIGWLLVAGFVPPVGLLYVFRTDLEERFLRQFLLADRLRLLAADALLPLAALLAGALIVWIAQGFAPEVAIVGAALILLLGMLLALSGAAAFGNRRVALARFLITAAGFGVVAVAGVNLGALAGLVVAVIANLLLCGVLMEAG